MGISNRRRFQSTRATTECGGRATLADAVGDSYLPEALSDSLRQELSQWTISGSGVQIANGSTALLLRGKRSSATFALEFRAPRQSAASAIP